MATVRSTAAPTGMAFTRYVKALAMAGGSHADAAEYADHTWRDQPSIGYALKTSVGAATPSDATWGAPLVETGISADIVGAVRNAEVINRLPLVRRVPFNTGVPVERTGGFSGSWVGAGARRPVRKSAFDSITLEPSVTSELIVLTRELVRATGPEAERALRDILVAAIAAFGDSQFLDPSNSGVAHVSPASVTANAPQVTSTGATAAQKTADLTSMLNAVGTHLDGGCWLMRRRTAIALATTLNAGNQLQFPTVTANGGTLFGLPVLISNAVPETGSPSDMYIVLLDSAHVLLGDDGAVDVAYADQTAIEMDDSPSSNMLVSMWQTGSTAVRIERQISWDLTRDDACCYMRVQY